MGRRRRCAKPSRVADVRPVGGVPVRFQWWMALTGIHEALSARLWDALERSAHPTAHQIVWAFFRLEHAPVVAITDRMMHLQERVTPRAWVILVEGAVDAGDLTHAEGNDIIEALLVWVTSHGAWKCG